MVKLISKKKIFCQIFVRHSLPLPGSLNGCASCSTPSDPPALPMWKTVDLDEHASSSVVVMSGQRHVNHSDVGCQISSLSPSSFVFPTDDAPAVSSNHHGSTHLTSPRPPTSPYRPPSSPYRPPSHHRENEVCGVWSAGWAKKTSSFGCVRLGRVGL